MSTDSTARGRFARYLAAARRRENMRRTFGFLAVLGIALALVTALATVAALQRGSTPGLTLGVRAVLALLCVALGVVLWWRPLARLRADGGADLLERADGAFDGRVRTFVDVERGDPGHPFLPLLARDALSVARRVPLSRVVPGAALALPLLALLLLGGALGVFSLQAPESWRNTALHFWWGWRDPSLVEPRYVSVMPGDAELLAGENLDLDIALSGFARDSVTLHARSGEGEWQSTEVGRSEDGQYHFTVFRVEEPLEYYVSAAWTESDVFAVDVVEPARLERIEAEYVFPEWTGLDPDVVADAGPLAAVKNTHVTLTFETDRPLLDGHLRLGDQRLALERDGLRYRASFTLSADTDYALVDRMLDREVGISPVHPVTVRGDEVPEVRFVMPGRDVSASPIEEVTVAVEARDDFGIETIELLYSVNAGDWQSVPLGDPAELDAAETGTVVVEHLFSLESMGTLLDTEPNERGDGAPARPAPMTPGDLISYYVRVRDHDSVSETDMMLVDVRPFERRFSEGQSGGGGGGGGGGGAANEGSEISQRQKEILIATWNLQRTVEQAGGDTSGHEDNAMLLSRLQTTLAEQARTLADRSEARELTDQGSEIRQFVDYLREAAEAMAPSALALDALEFEAAVQPQQRALQLLQRAEALFADIRMSQQEPGQGSGGQPGQDMTEMFELEMDLERNQYEQPDRGGSEASPERLDDIFEDLAELARRQQELAEAERENTLPAREERWRQQQLEREIERLQRDLEELEEQASGTDGEEGEALREAAAEAAERLEQARRALDEAEEERNAMEGERTRQADADGAESGVGEPSRSAAENASEELREALRGLGEERSRDLERALAEAVDTSEEILRGQRDTEAELRDIATRMARERESGTVTGALTRERADELAERKRELQRSLEEVRRDVASLESRFGEQAPTTGEALSEALERLDESGVVEMLGIAGDAIEGGQVATALPGESVITNAVREWRDRLVEAGDAAANEALQAGEPDDLQLADALDRIQDLRRRLDPEGSGGSRSEDDSPGEEGRRGQRVTDDRQDERGRQGEQARQGEGSRREQQGEGDQQVRQGEGSQQGQQGEEGGQRAQQGEGSQQGQQGEGDQQARQGEGGQQGQQGEGGRQARQGEGGQQGQQGEGGRQARQGEGGQQGQQGGRGGVAQGQGATGAGEPSSEGQDGYAFERSPSGAEADERAPGDTADSLESLASDLGALGIDPESLEELRASADIVRSGRNGINDARVEAEYRRVLRQIERIELRITDNAAVDTPGSDASGSGERLSESAADYYRRLSERPERVQR